MVNLYYKGHSNPILPRTIQFACWVLKKVDNYQLLVCATHNSQIEPLKNREIKTNNRLMLKQCNKFRFLKDQ